MYNKKDIEEAISYASSSNRLESNELSDEEIENIKKSIKNNKSNDNFFKSITELKDIKEKLLLIEENKNGKTK